MNSMNDLERQIPGELDRLRTKYPDFDTAAHKALLALAERERCGAKAGYIRLHYIAWARAHRN